MADAGAECGLRRTHADGHRDSERAAPPPPPSFARENSG
jgi:hypothetical protein